MRWMVLTVVGGLSLWSVAGCGHGSHEDHGDHAQHASEHGTEAGLPTLQLNDGKKWQVDDHTRQAATKLQGTLAAIQSIATVDQARGLAAQFDEGLAELIRGCTMTGPAHDQLHVFLAMLMPKVGALKETDDVATLEGVRRDMVAVFDAYQRHFE